MQVLSVQKINKYLLNLKKDNGKSLAKLFEYTYSNLYKVAYTYLNNKSDAEDVLSQAYENVVNYINTFDKNMNGYNWMFTIVKNCAIEFNKNEARRLDVTCDLDENIQDNNDVLERLLLKDSLSTLSDFELDLVRRRYWEGWTVKEISQDLNIPITTIYNRLDIIYKKLRKFYKDKL